MSEDRHKQVGIRDVARVAGVSVTTVSHVLNDSPHTRISEPTRQRVREVARELGYGPNRMAQGLRTQRSRMIGLISEEVATTPHAGRIILGAQAAARKAGFTLVLINADHDASEESKRLDVAALIDSQVDGILYATMYHREISLPPSLHAMPAVLIDASDRAGLVPSAVPDEFEGARAAVRALVAAGHRRIGFTNNTDDVPATHGRLAGYRAVLDEAGIDFDESLVASAVSEVSGGYLTASTLLDLPDRPTGLFCYNDRMAMGAYRAAAERGLAIPDDLSIVGFDNQEIIADSLFPGLTTVALPHYEMGVWAVDVLVGILNGQEDLRLLADHPTLMACPLVERNSVAPPRSSTSKG